MATTACSKALLNSVRVSNLARPITSEEKLILRAFQRQVERLRQSRIVQSGAAAFKYTTKIDFLTGKIETDFEGYDADAFQSQLPILRQFILNDDIRFNRVRKIIHRCCERKELLAWTEYVRVNWRTALARLPIDDHRFFHDAIDNVDNAVRKLFYGYGGLFHVDIHEPGEEEGVREIWEATLQHAFPYLWTCLNQLDSVLYLWLENPNEPVPSVPSDNEGKSPS